MARSRPCTRGHVVVGDVVVALGDGVRWVVVVDVLGDEVHDVHAEAVDAAVEPEAQHAVHRRFDRRHVPVEVGLLREEAVQVLLAAAGSSSVQAGVPWRNAERQLFAGASRHTYHSACSAAALDRLSTNHGCWSLVWLGTKSSRTRIPRAWASVSSSSRSARSPNNGSTSQWSLMS